jgi:hypothetical protein
MDPTNPNALALPSRDIISIVVQDCGCDEEKAIELLKVHSITIEFENSQTYSLFY